MPGNHWTLSGSLVSVLSTVDGPTSAVLLLMQLTFGAGVLNLSACDAFGNFASVLLSA